MRATSSCPRDHSRIGHGNGTMRRAEVERLAEQPAERLDRSAVAAAAEASGLANVGEGAVGKIKVGVGRVKVAFGKFKVAVGKVGVGVEKVGAGVREVELVGTSVETTWANDESWLDARVISSRRCKEASRQSDEASRQCDEASRHCDEASRHCEALARVRCNPFSSH